MSYKLAIKDEVHVEVKAVVNDGGTKRRFEFTLVCDRIAQEPLQKLIKDDDGKKTTEVIQDVAKNWIGQRLVLDDHGEPAEFSQEALAVMLSVPGLGTMIFTAYLNQVGAREKN